MIRSCRRPLTFIVLLVPGLSVPALAGELTDQIRQTTDRIIAIVQDSASKDPNKEAERRAKIRKIIDERFDWDAMARSAMGKHWRGLAEAQRKEFRGLFSQLVEQTYMARVEGYSGEKLVYKGDKVDGKYGVADVVITTVKGTDIPVSYRVLKKSDKWMVYDITIEGVSLVNNYRSQISSILDSSSYDDLVKKIRARLTEDGAGEGDKGKDHKAEDTKRKEGTL